MLSSYLDKRQALIERQAIRLTAMLLAMRKPAKSYSKTPQQHAQLINAQAELQLVLTKFFKNLASKAGDFINVDQYNFQIAKNHQTTLDKLDYNVEVVVNEQQIDNNDTNFIKVSLATVTKAVQAGFVATEITAKTPPLGISGTSALIQKLSTKQVASLVGKKILDDGSIVDNPDAKYNVMDTVRKDIVQSVKTSLSLGETSEQATARMAQIINPIDRAELIANTESVNAYQAGVTAFGEASGAVGKEWEVDSDPCPICQDNADAGPIAFDDTYPSGDDEPTAHPNCECGQRLIYQQEWDAIQGGNSYAPQTGITPADS